MALFLRCRDGKRRFWALSPPNRAWDCWPAGRGLARPVSVRSAHRRRAAHSFGGGRFQAAQNFSGSAGVARRPGQCSPRRCWYASAGRMLGTYFPAGHWPAGRNFAGRCCGRYTCRRHAIRRSSGNCPRKSDCRWNAPHRARRQRNRRAVRCLAIHSRKSGRCRSGLRRGHRQTVPRRRRRTRNQTGKHWALCRRTVRRKRKRRFRSQGGPSRFWWPGLSLCAPPCSPLCPAGSGRLRR